MHDFYLVRLSDHVKQEAEHHAQEDSVVQRHGQRRNEESPRELGTFERDRALAPEHCPRTTRRRAADQARGADRHPGRERVARDIGVRAVRDWIGLADACSWTRPMIATESSRQQQRTR